MHDLSIPPEVAAVLERLRGAGFDAYPVGGCVRDSLLGLTPHDWDLCTAACPEETLRLFPGSVTAGLRHGTVGVRAGGATIEVTTFRAESGYSDHRHPDRVDFVPTVEADLARRDFTVNAMALAADGTVIDPFGGQADLAARRLRAVGNPARRFQEDALRMLRALRFSAQLGFSIDPETRAAIRACAPLAGTLAVERVRDEMEKTLLSPRPELLGTLCELGLLPGLPPETTARWDALRAVLRERTRRWMALAALLGGCAFLRELRLDKRTLLACSACVSLQSETARTPLFWKSAVARYGAETALAAARVLSALYGGAAEETLRGILARGECCTVRQLALSGGALYARGLRGREIGRAQESLLRHVWAHPEDNRAETLAKILEEGVFEDGGFMDKPEAGV